MEKKLEQYNRCPGGWQNWITGDTPESSTPIGNGPIEEYGIPGLIVVRARNAEEASRKGDAGRKYDRNWATTRPQEKTWEVVVAYDHTSRKRRRMRRGEVVSRHKTYDLARRAAKRGVYWALKIRHKGE